MNFVECHEEPIHIPGSIQSFGYLIGIDAVSHSITFCRNISDIFEIGNLEGVFGSKLTDFPESFQNIIDSDIYTSLERYTRRENETYFDKIFIDKKNIIFCFQKQRIYFSGV